MSNMAAIVRLLILGLASLFLYACSDPKGASKSNFLAAVKVHLGANSGEHELCFPLTQSGYDTFDQATRSYTYQVSREDYERGSKNGSFPEIAAMLQLSELGYFSHSIENSGSQGYPTLDIRFTPTEDFKNQVDFGRERENYWRRVDRQLCTGARLEAVEVMSFTEPADRGGVRVSSATVKFRYVNLPTWADLEEVKAAWEEAQLADGQSFERDVALVLKDSGWVMNGFGKR